MAAIITDQIRILNAKNFLAGVSNASNSYYSFIGLTNPADYQTDWDSDPPSPKDNFDQENDYWDTMVALKKLTPMMRGRLFLKELGHRVQVMICIGMIIVDQILL